MAITELPLTLTQFQLLERQQHPMLLISSRLAQWMDANFNVK
jgi:hypothetical protein